MGTIDNRLLKFIYCATSNSYITCFNFCHIQWKKNRKAPLT